MRTKSISTKVWVMRTKRKRRPYNVTIQRENILRLYKPLTLSLIRLDRILKSDKAALWWEKLGGHICYGVK